MQVAIVVSVAGLILFELGRLLVLGGVAARVAAALVLGFFLFTWLRLRLARNKFAALVKAATKLVDAKQYSAALQKSDEALNASGKLTFRRGDLIAQSFLVRSAALRGLGRNPDALAASAHALALMCRVKNGGLQLAILDQAGTLLFETGHASRAIPLLEAAGKLALQIENEPHRIYRLQQIGLAYSRTGVHANAVAAFAKAIEIITKKSGADAADLSPMYLNLGNGYRRLEKLDDAERCYREALRLLEVNGVTSPERISQALLNLGVACGEAGRNEEAEKYYQQALDMRLGVYGRNDWRIGLNYNNLANCRWRAGDFAGAEDYVQKAIEFLEERPETLSHALGTLARIREDQGRLEEAIAALARARDVIQNLPTTDMSQLASFLEREGNLAARMGDESRAAECRSRANQIRQKLAAAPALENETSDMGETLKNLDAHLIQSLNYVKSLQGIS